MFSEGVVVWGFLAVSRFSPVILNGFRVVRREKPISPRCVEIIRYRAIYTNRFRTYIHTIPRLFYCGAETPENAIK